MYYRAVSEVGKVERISARNMDELRRKIWEEYHALTHYGRKFVVGVLNEHNNEVGRAYFEGVSLQYWKSPRTKGKTAFYHTGELAR